MWSCTHRCLWNVINKTQQFTWTIIKISLTSNAHDCGGTLSRKTSGSGPYIFLSGIRSWTRDKDTVAKVIFAAKITNAENKKEEKKNKNRIAFGSKQKLRLTNKQIAWLPLAFQRNYYTTFERNVYWIKFTWFLLTDECFPFFPWKALVFSPGHVHFYHNSVPVRFILVIRQIVIFIRYFLKNEGN